MLTLNEVAELVGITPQYLRNWITEGVVTPTVWGGKGTGNGHRFSVTAATGILVAYRLYHGEHGCVMSFFKSVVEAFAGVTEEWLLARFEKRATHLVTVHNGRPILQGKAPYWEDVLAAYEAVREKLNEKQAVEV